MGNSGPKVAGKIRTVLGVIDPGQVKRCLMHEHLNLYNCTPAPIGIRRDARKMIVPRLTELLQKHRCNALVETSIEGTGRDLETYVYIAKKTTFHVIATAGFYVFPRTPAWYEDVSAKKIARHLIRELTQGIDGTGILAGTLKGSSQSPRMHPLERKGFLALAIAHQETGAPITTHAIGCGPEQVELLLKEGVAPERISIGHAGSGKVTLSGILRMVDLGCTVLFTDTISQQGLDLADMPSWKFTLELLKRGHAERVMLSVDHWFEPRGNPAALASSGRSYSAVFDPFAKRLREHGVSAKTLDQIFVQNPRRMLSW
jgi:phosphotriesterase-related protein